MNQLSIGKYIAKKRKEKNLTQEQLAEKLNVSNKTVSRWETGKCMPDYSVISNLCEELDTTISELMNGKEQDHNEGSSNNERQMMDLLKRVQELEKQRNFLETITYIILSVILSTISNYFDGTTINNVISIVLTITAIITSAIGIIKALKNMKETSS